MSEKNTSTSGGLESRHHPVVITLHWFTVAAIIIVVAIILIREDIEGRAAKQLLMDWHRSLGLLVLAVMLLRMALRYFLRFGVVDHNLPPVLAILGKGGHAVLYALLLAIPVLGWAQSSARGQTVNLFGLIPLPPLPLITRDRDLAETLATWHETAAWLLLAVVLAHGTAALWHHFFRRDTVLHSMLPFSKLK
ncbi:MAG: cytochrome b [Candidatus Competibacteraceae bacterium]